MFIVGGAFSLNLFPNIDSVDIGSEMVAVIVKYL